MDEVKLRVESREAFRERTMAIARRIDGGDSSADLSEISFATMDGFLQLVTPQRWHLLRTLRRNGKTSSPALAILLGRDGESVEADIAHLHAVDLIDIDDAGDISVPWSRVSAEMDIGQAA